MIFNKIKNLLNNIITLKVIGFICIILILWYRVLHNRIPKELPLHLNNSSFITIIFLCASLCIALFIIITNRYKMISFSRNKLLFIITNYLYNSLYIFDEAFKRI